MRTVATWVVLLLLCDHVMAQSKESQKGVKSSASETAATGPTLAELEREVARITVQLSACRAGKVSTKSDGVREDAIVSLRALRSALDGGANFDMFRKYQIESRVKVDALPRTEENRDIRELSDLYRDALTFSVARMTGSIDQSALDAALAKYANDTDIIDALKKMFPGTYYRGKQHDYNEAIGKYVSSVLLLKANQMFEERFGDR